jgi:hypothetical protein
MNSARFSAYQLNRNLMLLTAQLFACLQVQKTLAACAHFFQLVFIFFACQPTVMNSNFGYVAGAEIFIVDLTAHNKRARVFTTWIQLHHSAAQR